MTVSLDVPTPTRPAARTVVSVGTAVFSLVAFGLFVAVQMTGAADGSPLATASAVFVLLTLLALCAVAALMVQEHPMAGTTAAVTAAIGAGGAWAGVFVLPSIVASGQMQTLSAYLGPVQFGYMLSFALLAAGWLMVAIVRLRAKETPTWAGIILLIGALLVLVPTADPLRILVLAGAVALSESRRRAR